VGWGGTLCAPVWILRGEGGVGGGGGGGGGGGLVVGGVDSRGWGVVVGGCVGGGGGRHTAYTENTEGNGTEGTMIFLKKPMRTR